MKFNPSKTAVSAFHLNIKFADKKLDIKFNGMSILHNAELKYLGVWLDMSLTYKHHIEKTVKKINSRNNIVQKLAGSNWSV